MLTKQRKTLYTCAEVIYSFLLPPILLTCPSFFHFARRLDMQGFGLTGSGLARFYCTKFRAELNPLIRLPSTLILSHEQCFLIFLSFLQIAILNTMVWADKKRILEISLLIALCVQF